MSRPLPLILAQAPGRPAGDWAGFAEDVERRVRLRPPGALVVYPELHLGESVPGRAAAPEDAAEPMDGKRGGFFSQLAGDLGIWLVPGSVYERGEDGQVYNTAPVYSPEGRYLAAYRKICPWRPYETTRPGSRFEVVVLPGVGRIGLSICYDTWFPEISRHLAWLGAELIVNVVRTGTSDRTQEEVLNRANAIANQVFVASVNSAAPSGVGRSLLIDPQGTVRSQTPDDGDATLTDVIDLDEVANVRRYGTAGLNRIWQQFRPGDPVLELPLYGGRIDPGTWAAVPSGRPGGGERP
ncbi:carbon-nitrogen hydrolase family protein [Amycolatopsis sp. PS_44_ISF1]|uniref:carbon-nitrogen hydrolase family protein n=1 Tax=Amycolatopsis sp. PS_44_ISF1 TaxID=2974917 RepID=UPI0028DEFB15|nr:carbon-nitrogen hydrolase family protein [Amycolatopsis sp. PS_44_ISF1]MDT8912298.1 carbon-nitrogen hydrolase family protein [Amycolatopsis sp. PS_44_ISF1]